MSRSENRSRGVRAVRTISGMVNSLPPGYTARRPATSDAPAIFELVAAHNIGAIGEPGYTADEIADELIEPGFDPDRDGWLVHDPAGRLVGWGWAMRKGDSDNVDVAVYTPADGHDASRWLWAAVQERAVELTAELDHPRAVVDVALYREETAAQEAAAARGYAVAATFNRLRIDFADADSTTVPVPPAGVTVRNGADESVRRDAYDVYVAGFSGHFGFVASPYAEWVEHFESQSVNDWALVDVAYADGEPVAMLGRTNGYVETDNCGYVQRIAVRPDRQGRGLGRFMLRYAFAADRALGRDGTLLHVDTDPSRPAIGLYLSVGMRPIRIIDVWRRTIERVKVGD